MKTKTEILHETRAAYSQRGSRAIEPTKYSSTCKYLTPDGKKCAIGRVLATHKPEMEGCALSPPSGIYLTWHMGNLEWDDDFLLPDYRGHDPQFWHELQIWHDTNEHFNEKDENAPYISVQGEKEFQTLLKRWGS